MRCNWKWQPFQPKIFSSSVFGHTFPSSVCPLLPDSSSSVLHFFPIITSVYFLPSVASLPWLSYFSTFWTWSLSDLSPASHWVQHELAEQVEPAGPWESVWSECCPLQPLYCWPRDLPHGVWKPLETGEICLTLFFFLPLKIWLLTNSSAELMWWPAYH